MAHVAIALRQRHAPSRRLMGTGHGRVGFCRRVAVALVTAASVVVGTTACLGPPSTPNIPKVPDKVTVELVPIVDVAPIYLGLKKGFFSEQNIDLTVDTAAGG